MSTPHDLKSLGLPTERKPITDIEGWFLRACAVVIVVGTAYIVVADEPDRKAVDVNVTMTSTEFAQALDRARRQGEADAFKRMRACEWRDQFRDEPPLKKWSKT